MTHWVIFTLRGWIAFLAFMNLGTAARCFMDEKFLHTKFFGIDESKPDKHIKDGPMVERVFGYWSLINGVVFIHCAVFIQDARILGIAACALLLYLCFFATEAFVFNTIVIKGAALYPFAMTGLSLLWLIISYRYLQCLDTEDDFDENEVLRRRFPFKGLVKKMR